MQNVTPQWHFSARGNEHKIIHHSINNEDWEMKLGIFCACYLCYLTTKQKLLCSARCASSRSQQPNIRHLGSILGSIIHGFPHTYKS